MLAGSSIIPDWAVTSATLALAMQDSDEALRLLAPYLGLTLETSTAVIGVAHVESRTKATRPRKHDHS